MTSKMAKIAAFREWPLAEAAEDAHHLAALGMSRSLHRQFDLLRWPHLLELYK
jgi:hypothetical protein